MKPSQQRPQLTPGELKSWGGPSERSPIEAGDQASALTPEDSGRGFCVSFFPHSLIHSFTLSCIY